MTSLIEDLDGPLLSDRRVYYIPPPERVRTDGDYVEWQQGKGRVYKTTAEIRFHEWLESRDMMDSRVRQQTDERHKLTARARMGQRLSDFLALANAAPDDVREFVEKWGPLAVYPEEHVLAPGDSWCEPSPEWKELLEATGGPVRVGPTLREPCSVYQSLAARAGGVLKIALVVRDGAPVENVRDLPPEFQEATFMFNGEVRHYFGSEYFTTNEQRRAARDQRHFVFEIVNDWIRASGVSLCIGFTDAGGFVAVDPSVSAAGEAWWTAYKERGRPRRPIPVLNPQTGQVEVVQAPVLCPSPLSGELACDVAAILVRPEGWAVCACGRLFKRYGPQKYCGTGCSFKEEKRREQIREAKGRHDAKRRRAPST